MLATFLTWTTYGFWLPNDQRGSGSDAVWAEHLKPFGRATKVTTRHSLADQRFDPEVRRHARSALKFPHVQLNGKQALSVAHAISAYCRKRRYAIYAFAVLPDHLHLVLAAAADDPHRLAGELKRITTAKLRETNQHPLAGFTDRRGRLPTPWAAGHWAVFLNRAEEVASRVAYVEQNPPKQGLPRQHWSFVTPLH